jgi:hypothetical protein
MRCTAYCLAKLNRMKTALRHPAPDPVTVSDTF